jgi:hypothetical protein
VDKAIKIIKASGATVPFSIQKLRKSLSRSGACEHIIEEVVREVENKLHDGITTKKIYQLAFRKLRKIQMLAASKYQLKKAIMELGPSGYPFEKYVSEIFNAQGHSVQTNLIMKGRCVNHELDVLAEQDEVQKVIECKYHNQQGTICDVKIPLYVHARFKDISEAMPKSKIQEGWIVTNTRFSGDAIQYGMCSALTLLGWDFPEGKGLRELIDQGGLYPITCLTTLTRKEKTKLMTVGIVLCRKLKTSKKTLIKIGIPSQRIETILNEAALLG